MIIVSNTLPITNLSAIGKLHLLQQIHGEIIISSAVFEELTQWGDSIPGAKEVKTSNWIQVKPINNMGLVQTLKNQLDEGESSAIALALELNADW
ncbi:hypothetical protein [Argonema galeatum]|uniref:hypothetical protein n=1 Tax=Argonema galeatum TaxID=2942762 RepID=UPI0020113B42|nr:hypothetical protein [Argonema galeatum]MCL1466120.1 hypothetical protein [Argonema galeatum A003/A1]